MIDSISSNLTGGKKNFVKHGLTAQWWIKISTYHAISTHPALRGHANSTWRWLLTSLTREYREGVGKRH